MKVPSKLSLRVVPKYKELYREGVLQTNQKQVRRKSETIILKARKKKGKRSISHRYDRLPLLRSRPGGVHQELVVWDLP